MEPDHIIETGDLHGWRLATYLCNSCEREWYDDNETSNPDYCPYCGFEQVTEEINNE